MALNSDNIIMKQIYDATGLVHTKVLDAFRYSAISINLINKSSEKDYDISELTKIVINLKGKDHRSTKKEFKLWVIGNCLTDMLEAFNCCIDKIIEIIDNHSPDKRIKKLQEQRIPVNEKLKILTQIIKNKYSEKVPLQVINEDHIDALCSIRKARNCIVHNDGIVDEETVAKTVDLFELKYFYVKDYVIFSDGSKIEASKAKKFKKEIAGFWSGLGCYTKRFKLHDNIVLTPKELYRIGIFIKHLTSVLSANLRKLFQYDYPDDILIL